MRTLGLAVLLLSLGGACRAGIIRYEVDAIFTPIYCSNEPTAEFPDEIPCDIDLSGHQSVGLFTVPSWMSDAAFGYFELGGYQLQGNSLLIYGDTPWPYLWNGLAVPVDPLDGGIEFETGSWPAGGIVLNNFNSGYGVSSFVGSIRGVCEAGCEATPEPPTLLTGSGGLLFLGLGFALFRRRLPGTWEYDNSR